MKHYCTQLTIKYVFETNGIQSSCQYVRHEVGRRQTRKSLYLIHTECTVQVRSNNQMLKLATHCNWKLNKTVSETCLWAEKWDKYLQPLLETLTIYLWLTLDIYTYNLSCISSWIHCHLYYLLMVDACLDCMHV